MFSISALSKVNCKILILALVFLLACPAGFAASFSKKYEKIISKKPVDVVSFSKMAIPAFMGAVDRHVLFLIPKVVEHENNFLISAQIMTVYRLDGILNAYTRFCEDNRGVFVWVQPQINNVGMCLSNKQDSAAFYFKARKVGRYQYVDEVEIEISSAKDQSFFSKEFLEFEINNGYMTPKMIAVEARQREDEYQKMRNDEKIRVQAEYDKNLNELLARSSQTRSDLLKIGAKVCTYAPEKPHSIIWGFVEAVANQKIKISLNGDMTKTLWSEPDTWYVCSNIH